MFLSRDPRKLYPHDRLMARVLLPFIPESVTPNMVTMVRLLLIPAVLYTLHAEQWTIGVPLFIFTAFTDAVDGSLARVRQKITEWGSFFDPLADKLFIGSVVLLIVAKYAGGRLALTILGMEALIALSAYWGKRKGRKISANIFGKTKMLTQVIGVTLLLFSVSTGNAALFPWSVAVLVLSLGLAFMSFLTYGL